MEYLKGFLIGSVLILIGIGFANITDNYAELRIETFKANLVKDCVLTEHVTFTHGRKQPVYSCPKKGGY